MSKNLSINEIISKYPTILDVMKYYYMSNETFHHSVNLFYNKEFLNKLDCELVWHEGVGNGIHDIKNNVVIVFEEDDPQLANYSFYKYDSLAWVDSWDFDKLADTANYEIQTIY